MRHVLPALALLFFMNGCAHAQEPQVCFPKDCVQVTIVRTPEEMTKGLSGHAPLANKEGMLFMFDTEGIYSFWMNDMTFALDILWLNKDGKIVYIEENLMPCTTDNCPKYTSQDLAQYVLEVPSGYIKTHLLKIGDSALLPQSFSK